jgi:hypothetical protein
MDWKTLLAYITGSVEEQLLLRNEYLVEENRIWRKQIEGRLLKAVYSSRMPSASLWPRSGPSWGSKPWKTSRPLSNPRRF